MLQRRIKKVDILVILGWILAFINPVIGGVLVGYFVWRSQPDTGLQIMLLSLTVVILYVIGFIVWATKKFKKIEQKLSLIEEKCKTEQ
jgi:MFS family permease